MENATKALLIAAAVLIAIVLVALGVNLLSSTGDTTQDAGEVAEQIGSSTSSAASSLDTALGKLEGKKMITFYLNDKLCSCPEGYTVKQAVEEGYLNWKEGIGSNPPTVFVNIDDKDLQIFFHDDEIGDGILYWNSNLIEGMRYVAV